MSDCVSCGQPPCICRCGLAGVGTWGHVLRQLEVAQANAAVLADKEEIKHRACRAGGLAHAQLVRSGK